MDERVIQFLQCPVCKNKFIFNGKSLVCKKGHCFDVSRKGYINFSQPRKEKLYNSNLFQNRSYIFELGLYKAVVNKINEMLEDLSIPNNSVLVDAGCGEGYYCREVHFKGCTKTIGFDLSKDAIQYASGKDKESFYMVADLANIPIQNNVAGIILNVFTPANYKEFRRIISKNGVIVKATPKENYLVELREVAYPFLINKTYNSHEVSEYIEKNVKIIKKERVKYSLAISSDDIIRIAQMTPLLSNIDISRLDFSHIDSITIDEEIVVGTLK